MEQELVKSWNEAYNQIKRLQKLRIDTTTALQNINKEIEKNRVIRRKIIVKAGVNNIELPLNK